jgi:hypothetical protein
MLAGEQRLQHRMYSFKAVEWEALLKAAEWEAEWFESAHRCITEDVMSCDVTDQRTAYSGYERGLK